MPATKTDVSTTPLGRPVRRCANDTNLRANPFSSTFSFHGSEDTALGDLSEVVACVARGVQEFRFPASSPPTLGQIGADVGERQPLFNLLGQRFQGNPDFDRVGGVAWPREDSHNCLAMIRSIRSSLEKRSRESRQHVC